MIDQVYTILVVDDAKDMQLLLDFDLTKAGYRVVCCDSGHEALVELSKTKIDLILLDIYMPNLSGLKTLEKLTKCEKNNNTSVIMLSASNDEDQIVSALELGALDYVLKPYVTKILLARIQTAIKLKEKNKQLEYFAKTDCLTGTHNRGSFFELSTKAIYLSNRTCQPLVIVMLDIDYFKRVNDSYGHDVGDKVLVRFVSCLKKYFREYDILGRIGGEEFAVCLPNISLENAYNVCERVRQKVEQLIFFTDEDEKKYVNITVSIGLTGTQGESIPLDYLLKQADKALYYAKKNGRNRVVGSSTVNSELQFKISQVANKQTVTTDDLAHINNNGLETNMENIEGIENSVGLSNVLGDESLFEEILIMFYQDHNEDAIKLQKAIENQDTASLKHIAHTLKGVSSSVGALELFSKVKDLDLAITENRNEVFNRLLSEMLPVFDKVMQSIKTNINIEG